VSQSRGDRVGRAETGAAPLLPVRRFMAQSERFMRLRRFLVRYACYMVTEPMKGA
jgi:hypothetical protein